ncbi:alpha/beta hydrolase family protein [Sphingomonas sp. MS122]|uniref:alpha/beta hydrolase family protein n=1 Tax=Sphingomonas sp. MS122 TaxID=3412683 RepID=UPI003C2F20A6
MRSSLIFLPLLLAACASTGDKPAPSPAAPPLFTETVGKPQRGIETLFVVVHGDGAAGTEIDISGFAKSLAATEPESAVVRLLRPGYADGAGNQSPGTRGAGAGDDYTSDRIAVVGDTIAALRNRYRRARVIAIGEGGGAAVVANLAGLRPNLIDGMVLVSCPCALPEWRRYMAGREKPADPWRAKIDSLDPLQTAGGIAPTLRAALISGADDKTVPARFARSYAEALSLRGIATDFRILPDQGSQILDDPQVIEATRRLASALPRKPQ